MALQMDIIPVSKGPLCRANVEDGVVLADEQLRATLERAYPALWRRVLARRAFHRAKDMCGAPGTQKRTPSQREIRYLDTLVRGVYAKHDLPEGHLLTDNDVYLAVPLQKGQTSCRELVRGEIVLRACKKDQPIMIDMIDSPYAYNSDLKQLIYDRGIPPADGLARAA